MVRTKRDKKGLGYKPLARHRTHCDHSEIVRKLQLRAKKKQKSVDGRGERFTEKKAMPLRTTVQERYTTQAKGPTI